MQMQVLLGMKEYKNFVHLVTLHVRKEKSPKKPQPLG